MKIFACIATNQMITQEIFGKNEVDFRLEIHQQK